MPQAVCEILGLENSAITTPDSDAREDESSDGGDRPASSYPKVSMPIAVANGINKHGEQATHALSTDWHLHNCWIIFLKRHFIASVFFLSSTWGGYLKLCVD